METLDKTSQTKEPVAPWWHTVLVMLPLAIGSGVSVHQHTLEHVNLPGLSFRLSAYFTVMVEEWFGVFLIWLALRRRGLSMGELIAGSWARSRAFLKDLSLAIGFLVVSVLISIAVTRLIGDPSSEISFVPENWREAVAWVFLAATAGFAEEFIFRGYFVRQFQAWTGNIAVAITLQGLLFGLAHGYYSTSMIEIAIYGWLIGTLAWWRKSLRPGMLAHGLEDATLGLLAFFFR